MGYRIRYGNITTKEILNVKLNTKKNSVIFLVLGTVVVLVAVAYLLNRSVEPIIYPGDPVVTKGAVNDMLKSIKGGKTVVEAFSDFCIRILQGKV